MAAALQCPNGIAAAQPRFRRSLTLYFIARMCPNDEADGLRKPIELISLASVRVCTPSHEVLTRCTEALFRIAPGMPPGGDDAKKLCSSAFHRPRNSHR